MSDQRQRYNEKFKEETVEYIQQSNKSIPEISKELNIPTDTLHQWMQQYIPVSEDPGGEGGNLDAKIPELSELEQQVKELQEESEILKKAIHYLSKDKK